MKASEYIKEKINKLQRGFAFTYDIFNDEVKNEKTIVKTLNRLAQSGKIIRLSKGRYYKVKNTIFGQLKPNQYQVVKDLLVDGRKVTGYLTGLSIYPVLGLTTQISNTIQIGKNETRPAFKRDFYSISFIKQKNIIKKDEIPLLQILDAIRFIKKIPDSSMQSSCKRFMAILQDLSVEDKVILVKRSLKYPPVTRALLGAMLDEIGDLALTESIRKSLNWITIYKLGEVSKLLSSAPRWNIK